jgi:hypothetical protein
MANTVGAPLLVFSKKGGMPALLSHYRPNKTVFAFTGRGLRAWKSMRLHASAALVKLFKAGWSHYRPNKMIFAFSGEPAWLPTCIECEVAYICGAFAYEIQQHAQPLQDSIGIHK